MQRCIHLNDHRHRHRHYCPLSCLHRGRISPICQWLWKWNIPFCASHPLRWGHQRRQSALLATHIRLKTHYTWDGWGMRRYSSSSPHSISINTRIFDHACSLAQLYFVNMEWTFALRYRKSAFPLFECWWIGRIRHTCFFAPPYIVYTTSICFGFAVWMELNWRVSIVSGQESSCCGTTAIATATEEVWYFNTNHWIVWLVNPTLQQMKYEYCIVSNNHRGGGFKLFAELSK